MSFNNPSLQSQNEVTINPKVISVPPQLINSLKTQMQDYKYQAAAGDQLLITVWDHPEFSSPQGLVMNSSENTTIQNSVQHWRAELYNQTYFNPQRTDTRSGNVNLIGGSLEQQLKPNWYLSYRTSFAYQGQDSGGMASGLFGGGYQLNLNYGFHPHAALLVGAIGGGGIDVGGGFIVEPEIGLRCDLSKQFGIDVSGGRMMSTSGSLQSNILNAGVVYSFGELVKLNN